jgi:hypothetical protein
LSLNQLGPKIPGQVIPLFGNVFGSPVNIPQRVYEKYGVVYSAGDRTSTSTAPTTFIFSYPAFVGLSGLLFAIAIIVILDAISLRIHSISPAVVGYAANGFFAVVSFSLLVSDFFTVMFSHGAIPGIALLFILTRVCASKNRGVLTRPKND